MKKISYTALFAGMILLAGAQNTPQISEEEKQRTLEELERSYEMEIYGYFSNNRPAAVLDIMPWEEWAYEHCDEYSNVSDLLNCLKNLTVEPIAGEPKMCRLIFKGKTRGSETFEDRKYIGQPWESIIDSIGAHIGFREKIFYGLTTVVELNLTNKNGKSILVNLDSGSMESVYAIEGKNSIGNGESEVLFGIDIPLDAEFSEISDGTATVRFNLPDEYETVKVNAGDVCKQPVKVSFRDFNLNVERVDSIGFVISDNMFFRERIDKTNYLFCKNGIWYKPQPSNNGWGYLNDILEYNGGNYTFEKWLKKKGIDPENLKVTLREYRVRSDSTYRFQKLGKYCSTGMSVDTILFYKPSAIEDERIFAESSVRITPYGHKNIYNENNALRSKLLDKLTLMRSKAVQEKNNDEDTSKEISIWESFFEDEPEIKETKDTANNSTLEIKAASKREFPQYDNKFNTLNPIVYGLCYTTAYDMLNRKSVNEETYRNNFAKHIHSGYAYGVNHYKELIRKNYSSLWQHIQKNAETTELEKLYFHSGALMGAYSTSPYPELEYIDTAICDVLKQNDKSSKSETKQEHNLLFIDWLSYILKEIDHCYDIVNRNRPDFLRQKHADYALIPNEWIDSITASNDITQSEALASAIAKFDSPAVPDGIRRLKDNMKLTPDERNALLAPNDMISYAVGVAQADWIMEYKWFIGGANRKEFDAMLLSPENHSKIIAAFEDGLRRAMSITECFKNAILRQDCDSICLMNKAIKAESNKAYRQDVVYGYVFMNGMDAVEIYRAGAKWDIPEKQMASGLRLDKDRVLEGFRDYLEGHLKMGVEYARTLTRGRIAIDWRLYENNKKAEKLSKMEFQPAIPLNIETGSQSELSAELSQMIKIPQEIAGQKISGKVMAAVVIEADGAVSKIEITSSPHPILSETVTDCIFRMRFVPAKYAGECVASVAVIPITF